MGETHLDACLKIVSDRHRRRVIYRLREESNGKTTIEDLIDQLSRSDSAAYLDRDELAIQLVHRPLSTLTDHGVVEVDPETDTVRYQSDEQIEAVLDSLPEQVAQTTS